MTRSLSIVLLLSACSHSVFAVRETPGGVPFYPVQAVDSTTLVYEERWFELTATAKLRAPGTPAAAVTDEKTAKPDKAKPKTTPKEPGTSKESGATKDVANDKSADTGKGADTPYDSTVVVLTKDPSFAHAVATKFALQSNAQAAWEYIGGVAANAANDSHQITAEPTQLATSDIQSKATFVGASHTRTTRPGSKVLYVNAKTPWGGSGSGSFELGADGTLRKLEGQQTDSLPSTVATLITGLVGTDAANTIVAKVVGASTPQVQGAAEVVSAKVTVIPVRRVYALTATMPLAPDGKQPPCNLAPQSNNLIVAPDECHVAITIKVVRGDGSDSDADKQDKADNALKFSGSVVLPSPKKDAE